MFFKCPVCGLKDNKTIMEDVFSVGDLVECPDCLNILMVQDSYKLEDFKDILADRLENQKVRDRLSESDSITVRYL